MHPIDPNKELLAFLERYQKSPGAPNSPANFFSQAVAQPASATPTQNYGAANDSLVKLLTGSQQTQQPVTSLSELMGNVEPPGSFSKVCETTGGWAKNLIGAAADVAGGAAQEPTVDPIYQMLMGMGSQFGSMDPAAMAQKMYAPQYDALQGIIDRAQQRYDSAYSDVGQMYQALANDVRGQAHASAAVADDTSKGVQQAYADASKTAQDTTSKNNAEMAAIMQRLGVQQAAPQVLQDSNKQLQQVLSTNAAKSGDAATYAQNIGQNQQDYVMNTGNTDALAGKNAQTALTGNFLQQLDGYNQKYADLAAAQAQAEGQFAQSQQSGYMDWIKQMLGYQQTQQDNQFRQASLDMQLQNNAASQALGQQKLQQSQLQSLFNGNDPYGATSYEAQQLFGDQGDGAAGTAMDKVIQAYTQGSQNDAQFNLGKFIAQLQQGASSPQEASNLAALASLYWTQLSNRPAAYSGFN